MKGAGLQFLPRCGLPTSLAVPVRRPLRVDARLLPGRERKHARVVGVVHEVRDRVGARELLADTGITIAGQPYAGERSAAVSLTRSPELLQPPWKVW